MVTLLFLQLFVPNDSAFALLNTSVVDNSKVGRQTNRCEIVINISNLTVRAKHSIGRRTKFSSNLHSVEEEIFQCLPILQH